MKLCLFVSLIPFVATLFATTAPAIPVNGYRAGDIVARNNLHGLSNDFTLREVELELYRRGKGWEAIKKIVTYKETPEQKAERKASLAEKAEKRKEYKKYGKMHAENAKKELKAAGEEYNVKAQFRGPHYAEHGAKAIEEAKKEWHRHTNLQQFKQADVSVNILPTGHKHVAVRYHNGGISGVSSHMVLH